MHSLKLDWISSACTLNEVLKKEEHKVEARYFKWQDLPGKVPKEGVTMRVVSGEKGMMVLFEIEPGVEIPVHSHPHEQMGTVLEGELTMNINGVEELLKAGDGYIAPSGVPHGAKAGDKGVKVLDFFSPPREDYK